MCFTEGVHRMLYREDKELSAGTKQAYIDGLNRLLAQRQALSQQLRDSYCKDFFSRQEEHRTALRQMLGWPLTEEKPLSPPAATAELLSREDGYCIYRMQFEILEGLNMAGLFFKADSNEPLPLVVVQHGGEGTPELISGFYGSTSNYHDMVHRVRQQGVHVFAPQLLLWHDDYRVAYDRQSVDARLKRVGSSITAIEVYGISRILDYFEAQSYVSAFGMVGLSYGGFYTLYTSAVDTRIQSAISCAFFNNGDANERSDWTWFRSAQMFDDAETACLTYPRKLCIEIGNRDNLFDCELGIESFARIKALCHTVGTQWVDFIVFDGTHEFCRDDAPIHRLVRDLKAADGSAENSRH